MELIATLVHNRNKAKNILIEVPEKSIVLFAEDLMISPNIVKYYSEKKNLFVVYNEDYFVNGKAYISMRGIDKGKLKWMVHKYYLWKNDYRCGWNPAPKLDPIVKIRGHSTCVAICYEIAFIAGYNKLFSIGKLAKKAKVELLLMPANWSFNWGLPQYVSTIAFKRISSLKASLFSTKQGQAFIKTRRKLEKITERGWVSIEI